jgi:glutathione S-transferase
VILLLPQSNPETPLWHESCELCPCSQKKRTRKLDGNGAKPDIAGGPRVPRPGILAIFHAKLVASPNDQHLPFRAGFTCVLTLYSWPKLYGVADNNGYGLKVFAFLRLTGVAFQHEHVFDASSAPRGQLPYIVDDGETIGDSDAIIAHLIRKYRLTIDDGLTRIERDTDHLIKRMLGDLYWVISYSRWKDERFWPAFRDALMREHPALTAEGLRKAREYNFQRYQFQGIGRYEPEAAYARGLVDLLVLANLLPARDYLHGDKPRSIDAAIYGFIANIHFYDIETPLKAFVAAHVNLVRHCNAIHAAVTASPRKVDNSRLQ